MTRFKTVSLLSVVFTLVLLIGTQNAGAFSFGPPDATTGAPNENNCNQCHVGNDKNAPGGALSLTLPETYLPNGVYTIIVDLSRAGQSRWGFEMTALAADGTRAGTFTVTDEQNTQRTEANSKQYIKHTAAGSAAGTNDTYKWEFEWTAPDSDIGPVTFYAAGNAANNDAGTAGDYIYITEMVSDSAPSAVAGVSLVVVGDAARATTDAIAGVSYKLTVKNTGTAKDTIHLESSAEFGIEGTVLGSLSERTLELDADASTDVTVRVSGDFFTRPGEYPIEVKATSDTDNTATATVTLTTTIGEVVGPTIEVPVPPEVDGPPVIEVPVVPEVEIPEQPEVEIPVEPEVEVPVEPEVGIAVPQPETPWDANSDGTVNIQDLVLVASEFNQSGEGLRGDVNGDGTVNVLDLVLVSSHFGENTAAGQ